MPWDNSREGRRKSAATYKDPEYQRNRAFAVRRAGGACEECHTRSRRLQCDHTIPVTQGGTHHHSNLRMLCSGPGSCHAKKTATEGGGARGDKPPPADPSPAPRTAW